MGIPKPNNWPNEQALTSRVWVDSAPCRPECQHLRAERVASCLLFHQVGERQLAAQLKEEVSVARRHIEHQRRAIEDQKRMLQESQAGAPMHLSFSVVVPPVN